MPSIPLKERCAERARLADVLAQAVADVYARNREYQRAKNRKESTVEITLVLQTARDVERAALHACDDHVEKHGCKL